MQSTASKTLWSRAASYEHRPTTPLLTALLGGLLFCAPARPPNGPLPRPLLSVGVRRGAAVSLAFCVLLLGVQRQEFNQSAQRWPAVNNLGGSTTGGLVPSGAFGVPDELDPQGFFPVVSRIEPASVGLSPCGKFLHLAVHAKHSKLFPFIAIRSH